ncbi:uncharacterized protein LOC105189209 [Harpegnathos saltator]|uniref:uncharacterized protein LOC105189209 n=1 Tax=Harpegnathos saltator TaxID=610380 RepID=UPI000948C1E8|nr:uncharacterized protein LOC105189209 [Harpegnathos saltator]
MTLSLCIIGYFDVVMSREFSRRNCCRKKSRKRNSCGGKTERIISLVRERTVIFLPALKMVLDNGERYYKINKILLSSLGLWPHRKTRCSRVKLILIDAIFVYALFVQLCTFSNANCNINLLLEVLSNVLPTLICIVKYNAYYANTITIELMMKQIQRDWDTLNDKREIEILNKYARIMYTCTIALILVTCVCVTIYDFVEVLPIIFDWLVPLNESRPYHLIMLSEYFVDSEKYFPLILLHESIAVLVGCLIILSTGTISLVYMEHLCAILRIVSFRLEHMLEKSGLQYFNVQTERIICDRIIRAVNLHRRALKFFDLFLSNFASSFCIMTVIGVASISINLFRILVYCNIKNLSEILLASTLLLAHFIYMFGANYIGQIIINHSENIFHVTYNNILWYTAPLQSQKMLLFLMYRTTKHIKPIIGKIFVASLEGFATLSTTSLSYFTVIYSLR